MGANKVVIAVDASDRTMDPVRLGENFARLLGAPVVLFSAFPYAPLQDPSGSIERKARDDGRETLLELGGLMDGVDIADAQVLASNSPARELQRISEDDDVGLIVVGSTHRGRIGRVVPGSVGERLLSGSACPVAIAPLGYADRDERQLRRIGVAFDDSEEAQHALDSAVELARRSRASLHLITVYERVPVGTSPLYAGTLPVSSADDQLEAAARAAMTKAVDQVRGTVEADGEFAVGDPAEQLVQRSADLDLLVTGSRGYGPLGAVLLGGTTHRLLSAAASPLLVIPRGQSSPG